MENKVIRRESLASETIIEYKEQPIEVFENMIKLFKELGATHIDLYAEKDWDDDVENIEFTPFKLYYESDYEKEIRLKKESEDRL